MKRENKLKLFYKIVEDTRVKLLNLPEDELTNGLCYYFQEYVEDNTTSVLWAEFKTRYFNPSIIRKLIPLDPHKQTSFIRKYVTPDYTPCDKLNWNDPELDEELLIKELKTIYWWHPNNKKIRIEVCDILAKQLYELMLEQHG